MKISIIFIFLLFFVPNIVLAEDSIFDSMCADPGSCEINAIFSLYSKSKKINYGLQNASALSDGNTLYFKNPKEQYQPPAINPGAITHAYQCAYTGFQAAISTPWGAGSLGKGIVSQNCERINRINMVEGQHFSQALKARLKIAIFCEDDRNKKAMLIAGERCPTIEDAKKLLIKRRKLKESYYKGKIKKSPVHIITFNDNVGD